MHDEIPIAGNHLVSLDDLMPDTPPATPAAAPGAVSLLAMDPADYVKLAFGELETEMFAIIENVGMTVHDVDTPQGMELAERDCAAFRDLRLAAERLHKQYKAPVLELGRMIDGRKTDIINWLSPYEQHYREAIKAGKERAAAAQAALLEAERQRVAGIEERIAALYALPGQALNECASHVETMLIATEAIIIDDSYGEYMEKASAAKSFALKMLGQALDTKRQAEADQAELERLRAQQPPTAPPKAPPAAPAPKASKRAPAKAAPLSQIDALLLTYHFLNGEAIDGDLLLQHVAATLEAAGIPMPPPPHQP